MTMFRILRIAHKLHEWHEKGRNISVAKLSNVEVDAESHGMVVHINHDGLLHDVVDSSHRPQPS